MTTEPTDPRDATIVALAEALESPLDPPPTVSERFLAEQRVRLDADLLPADFAVLHNDRKAEATWLARRALQPHGAQIKAARARWAKAQK
jgi:hypothetical protein